MPRTQKVSAERRSRRRFLADMLFAGGALSAALLVGKLGPSVEAATPTPTPKASPTPRPKLTPVNPPPPQPGGAVAPPPPKQTTTVITPGVRPQDVNPAGGACPARDERQ